MNPYPRPIEDSDEDEVLCYYSEDDEDSVAELAEIINQLHEEGIDLDDALFNVD